ncbi:hypothetical protein HPO96_03180 [Kribbella sandramycini]|uniref:Uncharacterized protein n=1 Tax=Kribbella sandramycini TaxID=60450 RepID=A0A7Y4KV25_9ACTN|nr:hypothetical protein [Kribbella sandramycini]MBB6568167.1 hypothetical protein [Kribbella sandramycini]NOL39239.1 hypothetical protein [Kribbella sandramycini]
MYDDTSEVVREFEAEAWPLEAAADSLHQVIDGFQDGDTRPLVIGDGDEPVLVVLAIADLADFRARVNDLLSNPVDAGWLRYWLRSNFDMSSERLVELLGVDADHGLSSLASQVNVEQAATLMPDHLRRTEAGGNPLMLIGDGMMATAALLAFPAFQVLLALEGGGTVEDDSCAHDDEEKPTTPLEVLAERLGPVSTQLVAQINAGREPGLPRYELHFEDELVDHLHELESRAQRAPGSEAYVELNDLLHQFDEMRSGQGELDDDEEELDEAPYLEATDLRAALPDLRDNFREGADDPYLIGYDGRPLAGLITFDLYEELQRVSVELGGADEAPVLPLPQPRWENGPEVLIFEASLAVCEAVIEDISNGEGSMIFIADEDGDPELVLAPLVWLWAYVDHLDLEGAV